MNKKSVIFCSILLICLICFAISNITIPTNAGGKLNVAWGLARQKDEKQPIFEEAYIQILNKYNGIYVGNSQTKNVYLTFDEGYENGYTSQILDILKAKNVPAAFFITSDYFNKNRALIKRMIDDGHIVGNHTKTHPSLCSITSEEKIKSELIYLEQQMLDEYGYKMTYFRPPKGEYNEYAMKCINSLGYTTVLWSFAYDDWNVNKQNRESYAMDKIISNLHPGSIMLLHAVSKDNANILERVIDEIIEKGYVFKSLDEFEK